jgi:hypothetical protein
MASIDITTQSGAVGNGDLQLQNGAPMDATLRFVTDAVNTASPLKLSTSLVQTTSTLKITTNDNPYIDAEDGSGNNRFTVGRAPASQQVNVDFASNPAGSTTAVGAIRTYRDGTNLSEAMTFIEDGSVGIGTTAPVGLLDLYKAAAATRLAIRGDAGQNRLISYRTGALQRFGLYVNNTAESGSNAGSDFAIRAYSDAGTLLSTPLFIQRSTANIGIGTTTPNIYSTLGATNIVSIQATGTDAGALLDIAGTGTGFSGVNMGNATIRRAFLGTVNGSSFGIYTNPTNTGTAVTERLTITSAGNVGIGTASPTAKLEVVDGNGIGVRIGDISTEPVSQTAVFVGPSTSGLTGGNGDLVLIPRTSDARNIVFYAGSGTPTLKTTITNDGYLRMAASTGGIQFNGDTAAANALDDYEEGTWTPGFTLNSGSVSAYTSSGSYTKIGKVVNLTMRITFTTTLLAEIDEITGYPFTSQTSSPLALGAVREATNSGNMWQWLAFSNSTQGILRRYDNAKVLTNGDSFVGTLTYFV